MSETLEKVIGLASISSEIPKGPEVVRIALSVCGCYVNEKITFVTANAEGVARILGITMQDLECAAVAAMFFGKPEVVAVYVQRDVAESKLSQLKAEIPFIARGHHSFQLVDE
jgi:hypothetical protein